MSLKEDALSKIEELLGLGKTPKQVAQNCLEICLNEPNYSSFKSNYPALLIYSLIQKKVSIESFEQVIAFLYEKEDMSMTFFRFFNGSGTSISIKGHALLTSMEHAKLCFPNHSEQEIEEKKEQLIKDFHPSIWDKLYYTFLSVEKENENTKIIFNKETLPYLLVMLKNINVKKFEELQSCAFTYYFSDNFLDNIKEFDPIMSVIANNTAFQSKSEKYNGFYRSLLESSINNVYENSKEQNRELYQKLLQIIPNLEDIYFTAAFEYRHKKVNFKINSSLIKLAEDNNLKLAKKVIEMYQTINKKISPADLESLRKELSSSIKVYFESYLVQDFTDLIDITKPFDDNRCAVYFLEANLNKGEIKLKEEQVFYLRKEIQALKTKEAMSYLYDEIKEEKLIPALNYHLLNQTIETKKEPIKKKKI